MNVRLARQVARRGAVVLCVSTALGSLLAPAALADDPLGDVVEEAVSTIDETVDDTTDAVGDSVDTVTEVVAASTPGTDDVTSTAGGATGSIPNVGAIGRTADAPNEPDASSGTSSPPNGTFVGGADRGPGRDGGTAPKDRERQNAFGTREWIWQADDRLESTWANVPLESRIQQVDTTDETDPCREDPSLVCLGLLYGMGRYAKFFSSVLGVLATTGIGVLGLMAIALALGTGGSAALVVARGTATEELVAGGSRRRIRRP